MTDVIARDPIVPLDAEASRAAGAAFEAAWAIFRGEIPAAHAANDAKVRLARAINDTKVRLARAILELMRAGERDPARIRQRALDAVRRCDERAVPERRALG